MPATRCFRCGFEGELADELCRYCGAELTVPVASDEQTHVYPQGETLNEFPPVDDVKPLKGVGTVLGPTLWVFSNNIWLVTKLVVVIFAPFEFFKVLSLSKMNIDWQTLAVTTLLQIFCGILVAPAIIYSFYVVFRTDKAPSVNEALRFGLSRIGRLFIPAAIVAVLMSIGLMLLVIPGIIVLCTFNLVYPIATLENRSPIEILKRSRNLTRGHRWTIFFSTLIIFLLCSMVEGPLTWVSSMLTLSGTVFWPINVAIAILIDIVNEIQTVLSLVIFLSVAPYFKINSRALAHANTN
jgi:hypothetical protein